MNEKSEVGVIAEAMLEKKAQDVVSLDLTRIGTAIADHFVICNADSTTQVVAISDYVEEMMEKEFDRSVLRKQGRENAFWIILDYSDIVVHIFKTDQRLFSRSGSRSRCCSRMTASGGCVSRVAVSTGFLWSICSFCWGWPICGRPPARPIRSSASGWMSRTACW